MLYYGHRVRETSPEEKKRKDTAKTRKGTTMKKAVEIKLTKFDEGTITIRNISYGYGPNDRRTSADSTDDELMKMACFLVVKFLIQTYSLSFDEAAKCIDYPSIKVINEAA